jgi:VanZ family protein
MSRPRRSRWTIAGLLAGLLLVGELLPLPFARHPAFERVGPDKLLHFAGHAGFGGALAAAVGERVDARPAAVLAVAVSTAYARLLGRFQERIPGRVSEPADYAAALLGSVAGAALWLRTASVE